MSNKIDFASLPINPIQSFSDKIFANLERAIDEVIDYEFSQSKINQKEIDNLTNQINKSQKEIIDQKKLLKINAKKIANVFIIISFVLLIGLAFIPIFNKNKKIIKEFNQFKQLKENEILKDRNLRFNLMLSGFSATSIHELIINVFQKFDIQISEYFDSQEVLNLLKNSFNVLDIYSGIKGILKNSPFYDLMLREHNIRNVATSNSMSFPYTTIEYDSENRPHTVIRYETLTAIHNEPTPFLDETNLLIYKTNFLPDFSFNVTKGKSNKSVMLENSTFLKYFNIEIDPNQQLYLNQFFTIKSQEDFVNWYQHESSNIYEFTKYLDSLYIFGNNESLNFMNILNRLVTNAQILQNDKNFELTDAINLVKKIIYAYCSKIVKMLQIPLLVPGISREWYKKDKTYLIANNSNLSIPSLTQNENVDFNILLLPMLANNLISFNKFSEFLKRKPWLEIINYQKIFLDIFKANLKIKSYFSETKVDLVTVYGMEVGMKTIPVTYEKFHPIDEDKYAIFINHPTNTNNIILVSSKIKNNLFDGVYENKEFANKMLQNYIWTNNPSSLENSKNKEKLIEYVQEINQLNEKMQLDLIFKIDNKGISILINNLDNLNEVIEQKIIRILTNIKNDNFVI
ncbi:hypothetical protein [Mycoplasmoides pirum]|uniref:hypothetical protein n=1 Tax=Mycoplasmoides pirum TaxID=2122 RepID=UPI000485FFC3|nr:hypothetical protein [Mycoplasmoides pirum]